MFRAHPREVGGSRGGGGQCLRVRWAVEFRTREEMRVSTAQHAKKACPLGLQLVWRSCMEAKKSSIRNGSSFQVGKNSAGPGMAGSAAGGA